MAKMENLSYPIGKFAKPDLIAEPLVDSWISEIESFPGRLSDLVSGLSEQELAWQYRPNGWTVKQVVHHCADSHMNSFIRFKLSLTEENPIIRPYREDKWARLEDTTHVDIAESLKILEGLHKRWTVLLKSLSNKDLQRCYIHPDEETPITLAESIGLYAWHSNHHLAHIQQALTGNKIT